MEQKCATPNRRTSGDKKKSCWCCRKLMELFFSPIGLTGLVVAYIVFGAYLFRSLEGPHELQRTSQVVSLRNLTVHKLWNITDKFNVLYKENWTAMVSKEMVLFQQQLIEAVKDGYDGGSESPPSSKNSQGQNHHQNQQQPQRHSSGQWSFSGAFLYSLTVITTIGYGKISPRTDEGKILTILYATFGIPLVLLYLTTVGSSLATSFRSMYGRLCSCSSKSVPSAQERRAATIRSRNMKQQQQQQQQLQQLKQHQNANCVSMSNTGTLGHGGVMAQAGAPGSSGTLPPNNHTTYMAACNHHHHHHHCHQPVWANGVTLIDPMATELGAFKLGGTDGSFELTEAATAVDGLENYYDGDKANKNRASCNEEDEEEDEEEAVRVPISLSLLILVGYVAGGGKLFATLNKSWTFLESSYFCFVSLSTIGFGVPGHGSGSSSSVSSDHASLSPEKWTIFCSVYLMTGLVLIAMCFSLIHDEVVQKLRHYRAKEPRNVIIKDHEEMDYDNELDVL